MEKPMENSSDQGEDPEERPPPATRKICPLRAILDGMPEKWKDVDGMPPEWNYTAEQDDAKSIPPGEGPGGRKTSALSAILSGFPRVMERRDSEQTRALFLEEMALQFDKKKGRKDSANDAATQAAMEAEIERGLRTRQYSEVLDSLASGASEKTDDQKSYTQKLDDMVHQTGDEGLIRSWNEKKKKKHADKMAVSSRSSATMLNAAFNVKEFTDDSTSYSTWLDGKSSEDNRGSQDDETHKQSEGGELREPRFREDSAANFLNSLTSQILDEFGDSQKIEVDDAHVESEDPNETGFHEDSEDKLLGAVIQQVMEEFTDYRSRESPTSDQSDQSEGPKRRRFRERSALRLLKALSEQIRPELKIRGGGERSREKSALHFLNTVREQIMERVQDTPPQIPTSNAQSIELDPQYETEYDIPNSSDQNAHSETVYEVEVVRDEDVQPETNYESPSSSDHNAQTETGHSVETSNKQNVQPETENGVETSSDQNFQPETQYEQEQ